LFSHYGPLAVCVVVPSFESERSEIYPRVSIEAKTILAEEDGKVPYSEPDHAEKALAWVLESLCLHAYDMGLVQAVKVFKKDNHREK